MTSSFVTGYTQSTPGTPVTTPIEPGTDGLFVKITISNDTEDSVLRNVSAEIKTKLESMGLTPKDTFVSQHWRGGAIKLENLNSGDQNKVTLYIPVDWKKDYFLANFNSDPRSAEVSATGESGPINGNVGAVAPETVGKTVTDAQPLQYTPLFPQPSITASVTTEDDQPITQDPANIHGSDKVKVTFTPRVDGANGYNPVMCVKAAVTGSPGSPLSINDLTLHNPVHGVAIVTNTICPPEEIEISLPNNPGQAIPAVTFLVDSKRGPIDAISPNEITATLRVDPMIEGKDNVGARRISSTPVSKTVTVSPGVDLKVTSEWIDEAGKKIDGDVVFDDFVTETKPVRARISVSNIGEDPAKAANSTVKVKIPTGFTIDGTPTGSGWNCQVSNETDHALLTCTRVDNLPGNEGDPLEVIVKSPSGPGVRLTTDPLVIRGGHADNRGAVSPFDQNPDNDKVDTQARVNIPKPDFAPVIEITDKLRRKSPDIKPFEVEVTHQGDPVRARELRVRINGENGSPTLKVTNPNDWQCTTENIYIDCVWPQPISPNKGKLPNIQLTANMDNADGASLVATTIWERPGQNGQPAVPTADVNPGNDRSTVGFTPFSDWVDAEVKVSFENPTPNAGEDPKPKIVVSHNDGGAPIPPQTSLVVTVPPGVTVQDGGIFSGCRETDAQKHEWTCQSTQPIQANAIGEGPRVDGMSGTGQTIKVRVEVPQDRNPSNNEASAVTGRDGSSNYPDLQVKARWLGPEGKPLKNPASYLDYFTEIKPVRARIFITNVGSAPVPADQATVKLIIPSGFTIGEQQNTNGWSCRVQVLGSNNELICTRKHRLPGNQKRAFMVKIKSETGPGIRLPEHGIHIKGGFANNRAVAVREDVNIKNDTVNLKAEVRVPKLDIWPVIAMPHPFIHTQDTQQVFSIDVHHKGDRLRKDEATVELFTDKGTLPIEVTNANGWSCTPKSTNVICRYPVITQSGEQRLPRIEAVVDASLHHVPFKLSAQTVWLRSGRGGGVEPTADTTTANDLCELIVQQAPADGE